LRLEPWRAAFSFFSDVCFGKLLFVPADWDVRVRHIERSRGFEKADLGSM
jgi:hypothetical protein